MVGDTLCLIAQSITTTTGDRIVLTIDLNTNEVTSGGAVFVVSACYRGGHTRSWSYR